MHQARLARRATAEAVGTALLVAIVVGSGIEAQHVSPHDVGLQLLESSIATGAGLVALILAFGAVSGAHFNPLVTMADRILGGMGSRDAAVYVSAQVVGACAGAMVANLMFELPAIDISTNDRASGAHWLGEVVAAFGLLLIILGVVRAGRASSAAFAVGAYIAAAYWFTSSTSFANPAVTVGRMLTDTFAGIAPEAVPGYVAAQVVGALLAVALALSLFPHVPAVDLVVPHDEPMTRGMAEDRRPSVVFLCVHNAGRSQMALGWFEHYAGGRAVAWSGGSVPATEVNPSAVAAMAEVGIDISREFPKPWTDEIVQAADVVVTMGCGDACPVFPGTRYEDWALEDPAGRDVEAVRPIRDEIGCRVHALLERLGVARP